jgi:membrane protein DedA with SNARE-associated domain
MIAFVERVQQSLEAILAALGYGGIILMAALETIVPPLPSDWIVPVAGMLVAQGELHWALVIGAATLGSLLGASVQYALGYRLGRRLGSSRYPWEIIHRP